MQNVSIARRYARALIEVAQHNADEVLEQLGRIADAVETSAELNDVLTNPAYARLDRSKIVEALVSSVGAVDPLVSNLLRLLSDRSRLQSLPAIVRVYRDLADTRAGRVRGKVTSAIALPKDVLDRLERSLERVTQRNVVLESKVDPEVLGGVAAQVGSLVYDGTLRTELRALRRELVDR